SSRWPSCPPIFLPLRWRRLLVLRGLRANPSLEGGLLLLWLSLAWRASSSCTRATNAATCTRRSAFSAFRVAISSAGVMRLCYTCSATLRDLTHYKWHDTASGSVVGLASVFRLHLVRAPAGVTHWGHIPEPRWCTVPTTSRLGDA